MGNNAVGIAGVATSYTDNIRIMAIKFLDAGGEGKFSDAILGLEYAISKGAVISNNSWGATGVGYDMWQVFQKVLNAIGAGGHLFIGAAGNSGISIDGSSNLPCSFASEQLICVASHTRTDSVSAFSNFGANMVDLVAPGSSIMSLIPGGSTQSYSGTSMATPFVAGLATLLKSFRPALTPVQIKALIEQNVESVSSYAGKTTTGGRMNMRKAMQACANEYPVQATAQTNITGLAFTDDNNYIGQLGGTLTVNFGTGQRPGEQFSSIQVYYLDSAKNRMLPALNIDAHTIPDGFLTTLDLSVHPTSSVQVGAVYLAAYPANNLGTIAPDYGHYIVLEDRGHPQYNGNSFAVKYPDSDSRPCHMLATVTWTAAASEVEITHYRIYQLVQDPSSTSGYAKVVLGESTFNNPYNRFGR